MIPLYGGSTAKGIVPSRGAGQIIYRARFAQKHGIILPAIAAIHTRRIAKEKHRRLIGTSLKYPATKVGNAAGKGYAR